MSFWGVEIISLTVCDREDLERTLNATARNAGIEIVGGFRAPDAPRVKLAGTRALEAPARPAPPDPVGARGIGGTGAPPPGDDVVLVEVPPPAVACVAVEVRELTGAEVPRGLEVDEEAELPPPQPISTRTIPRVADAAQMALIRASIVADNWARG